MYREAVQFFEGSHNELAVARCKYNLANTLVQLFETGEAEKCYRDARDIYEKAGHVLDANDARYGMAWLQMLTGRFHVALLELSDCEKCYRNAGDPRGEALCTLDRAEVYLGLGLYSDAFDSSRVAERLCTKLNLRYEAAKAALFRAQSAFALDKSTEAMLALKRARGGFAAEENSGFLGVAHLVAADVTKDMQQRSSELTSARKLFTRAQLPLWEAICDVEEASIPRRTRQALERLSRNNAAQNVPHVYALWQTVAGDVEYQKGHVATAKRHWQNAADRLDTVRAQLPPVELRNAYNQKQMSPHLRLIATELNDDPKTAAVWSERYKTAGVWSPVSMDPDSKSSRKRVEESLDALAQKVATIAHQITGQSGERSISMTTTSKALSTLQKRVREELIAVESSSRKSLDNIEELAKEIKSVSNRLPIVQFHLVDDEITAFVHENGETRLRRYKNGRSRLALALQRWRFLLEGELLVNHFGKRNVTSAEHILWRELGEWLWAPLEIGKISAKVLILPEGELANLPWTALVSNGEPLALNHQFVLSPSLRHYLAARKIKVTSSKVEIIRGAADNLPLVDEESEALSRRAGGTATLYKNCRRQDWLNLGNARVWHFAGHSVLRGDNPFYSFLSLEDGPIFAADFRLKRCAIELVTLAACRSGEQVALPGEESTGLVRSFLEMGARNVIAGYWPVSDETTALWMGAFYQEYFNGARILEAAQRASLFVRERFPAVYHWGAFTVFGAGD
jgi:tetratricopeptide (TPR) repeat protein